MSEGRHQRARIEELDAEATRLEAEFASLGAALEVAEVELRQAEEAARQTREETSRLGAEDAEVARLITQMEGMMNATKPFDAPLKVRRGLLRRAWGAISTWWEP